MKFKENTRLKKYGYKQEWQESWRNYANEGNLRNVHCTKLYLKWVFLTLFSIFCPFQVKMGAKYQATALGLVSNVKE